MTKEKHGWMLILFALLAALVTAGACYPQRVQPPRSPLSPALIGELGEEVWRVEEVTYQGQAVQFDAVAPVYLRFAPTGVLSVKSTCGGGGWPIYFEGEHQYQLAEGDWAGQDCGKTRNEQESRVVSALAVTNTYELNGDQLVLSGDDARVVLALDTTRLSGW